MSSVFPDADVVLTGDLHEQWFFPITRARLSNKGQVYHDEQLFIQTSTYKEEYGN